MRDFEGLEIERLWEDAGRYLVVRLDFSEIKNFESPDQFKVRLTSLLARRFRPVDFSFAPSPWFTVHDQLSDWFRELPANSLVLLIDEYDAPLTACLSSPEVFESVRMELSNFYSVIKSNDRALRFLFMTGITKELLKNYSDEREKLSALKPLMT